MRKDFDIGGKYVVLSVSTNIQSPAVIVTVKLSDRMADIDSISVAFPVKSIRSAEHFVMNATEEEARRGFAKVMSEFGEFLWHVDKAGNDSNLLIVFYVQIMPDDFVMQLHRF